MKISITGVSGFIGSNIARVAAGYGHEITALVRKTSKREHIEPFVSTFVVGSHDDQDAIKELVEHADVVIHDSFDWNSLRNGTLDDHLKSNLDGSIKLLSASKGQHFIYMSSIAVHHHMHDKWNGVIDESHPTRPGSLYGACKSAVEAHLWSAHANSGQTVTAIRPCAVYGIDPTTKRSIGWPIIESIKAGKSFTKLGGGKFVHVDDVATATIASIDNPKASPRVYNLVDCYARWSDWATISAEELGVEIKIDDSSPVAAKNSFETSDVANDLGVTLNRGMEGIREQIKELIHG